MHYKSFLIFAKYHRWERWELVDEADTLVDILAFADIQRKEIYNGVQSEVLIVSLCETATLLMIQGKENKDA